MALSGSLVIGPDRGGRSVAIVEGRVAATAPAGVAVLACPHGEIAPGAVCAHTHLYSALACYGMPSPDPPPQNFLQILERVWWRLDRAIDADSLRAGARDYVARALLAGTTTLIDHHESSNLIAGSLSILAEVCHQLGMRALLCYGATERNFGRAEAQRGLAECGRLDGSPLVRGAVGLHASFTVSDDTVRDAGDLARRLGAVVHVHVAEDQADVDDARRRGAAGPLERLLSLGALVPGSILAHGVRLSAEQVRLADSAGCWFVHNPRSNDGNRVGYAGALSAASRVALGADGWDPDMAVEEAALLRNAEQHHDAGVGGRLAAGHRLVAERFGSAARALAPGALGDVVVREGGKVRHVVVNGRQVVGDGMLVDRRPGLITAAARIEAARLWSRRELSGLNSSKGTAMARLGLETTLVDADVYARTLVRFREAGVVLPTIGQLKDPRPFRPGSPPGCGTSMRMPRIRSICSASTGSTTPRGAGLVEVPAHIELPPRLTGVPARIVLALGNRFPMIRAHKVLAAYGCLVPRVVTGQFDPTRHRAIWPSTGQLLPRRRRHLAHSRLPRRRGAAGEHEPGALRLARRMGRRPGRHHPHAGIGEQREGDLRRLRGARLAIPPTSSSTSSASSATTWSTASAPAPRWKKCSASWPKAAPARGSRPSWRRPARPARSAAGDHLKQTTAPGSSRWRRRSARRCSATATASTTSRASATSTCPTSTM